MAPAKEPSLAFMPTSNDALYSPVQPSDSCSPFSNEGLFAISAHRVQDGGIAMSPSQTPSSKSSNPQIPQPGRKLSVSTGHHEMPSTSSLLPSSARDGPDPHDEVFWYNLHLETLENFEKERSTWRKMTDRLRRDVDKLKAELDGSRGPSRNDSAFYSTSGKENDKIFYNASMVSKANEKLKEFSVVSPHGSSQSPDHTSSPTTMGNMGRKISGAMRLPSISEDVATPPKRVSIAEPTVIEPISTSETPAVIMDDPLAPPSTVRPLSPPPPAYIIDAGHTPRRSNTGSSNSLATKRPTIRNNSIIPGAHLDLSDLEAALVDEMDDDPELRSPKVLPTMPSKGSSDMLAALNERLEQVAAYPEENEPEALRTSPPEASDQDVAVEEEEQEEEQEEEEEVKVPDTGIKLKTTRSINFGAQLGQLR